MEGPRVTFKTLKLLAAVGALSAATAVAQDAPKAKLPTSDLVANQKLADKVARQLGSHPAAYTADVKVFTEGGTVTVMGTCKEDAHKQAILKTVSTTDGVTLVRDGLKVAATLPAPTMPAPAMPAPVVKQAQGIGGGPREVAAPFAVPPSTIPGAPVGEPMVEPLPLGQAGGQAAGSPPLPPYAWPTYAPYPNISRVGYPTAYPYNAFPYIGPFYPFPKVPLGWRSVTLSWEDGHWWMGRKQSPQDYWRVKFGY
jgi:hypothetical protein